MWECVKIGYHIISLYHQLVKIVFYRDLELNRSNSAVSMSCDNSDYSYAQYAQAGPNTRIIDNMTELLEEPVEEKQGEVSRPVWWPDRLTIC